MAALYDGPGDMIASLSREAAVRNAMGYGTSLGTWQVMTVISGFAIINATREKERPRPRWHPYHRHDE